MTSATAFELEFLRRRNLLREDVRKPESKRNETGNTWKHSLKAALEAEGYTAILEKAHATYKNNKRIKNVKSDLSVYKDGVLIAVIESKDYFTIDYIRRACGELSRIIKSYRSQESIEVVGFCFQGRKAYNETDELINDELTYYDEDIEMITMIDQNRKKINGKLQTTVNTDFDVKYDEVNKIVEKLNAIIQ
tara:strand:+ start:2839 stop:3414 length:576 start_codon:yes stop_codon:yes gene_type:complete